MALVLMTSCADIAAAHNADRPATIQASDGSSIVIPSGVQPRSLVLVGVDHSVSDRANENALMRFLVQSVIPEAVKRRATVVVDLVGANGFNEGTGVVQVDFAQRPEDQDIDPKAIAATNAQKVVTAVSRALDSQPSSGSDPLGFYRRASDVRAQLPRTTVLAVYLGDGGQSTQDCDLGVQPVANSADMQATAQTCLGTQPLDLHHVEVWNLGIGLSSGPGGMTATQALDVEQFLKFVATTAGATVNKSTVEPIPDSGA